MSAADAPPPPAPPPPAELDPSEDDDDEEPPSFDSDEIAAAAREVGVKAFNEGRLDDAHRIQYGVLKHFTAKHGESSAQCAMYYLDYGVTLLALIQSQDPEAAALAGNTGEENEDVELCSNILELARICFDKLEAETTDESALKTLQLRQAEVHESLAQLRHERDEESEALKELEWALFLRKSALEDSHRVVISTMFQVGALYLRNEDFDKAEETFAEALELAKGNPTVPADLVEDLTQYYDEAKEMREQGGIESVKREIRGLFPEEAEASLRELTAPEGAPSLVSAVPAELASAVRVHHGGLMASVPMRESSSSMSFFPRQQFGDSVNLANDGNSRSQVINTAVPVRRKERPRPAGDENNGAAAKKQHRAEGNGGASSANTPTA
jgi:tetratricopeptide (TPR) repeat protein